MTAAPIRAIRTFESAVVQVLAENLACHPSLMRWLALRALPELSVEIAADGTRVDFAPSGAEVDPGWDLKVIGDVGPIEIGLLIAVRFDYRASAARQAREAAKALAASGEAAVALAIWIAPKAEIDRLADDPVHYDRAVPLETIVAMLEGEARCSAYELQRRRDFQLGLLRRALRVAAEASQTPLDPRESFRRDYLEMIADEAPLLAVEQARDRADPDFATLAFDPSALPRWPFMPSARLAHHLKEGFASILIHDWGKDIDGLAAVMEPALDSTRYSLAIAPSHLPRGKPGVLILVETPPLHPERPFALQRRDARECVRAIDGLRGWFAARKSVASYWADFIGGAEEAKKGHKRVRRNFSLG